MLSSIQNVYKTKKPRDRGFLSVCYQLRVFFTYLSPVSTVVEKVKIIGIGKNVAHTCRFNSTMIRRKYF